MKAVVAANGELHARDERHLADADLIVAADGGARLVERMGRLPALVVGDLDSISISGALRRAVDQGAVEVDRRPVDKDETDTELALAAALRAGADRVVVLAATGGGRLDHTIANVLLLANPAHRRRDVRLAAGGSQVRALHGPESLVLDARRGDTVSLIPVGGDAVGISTEGLAFPLHGEALAFGSGRGVSNRVVAVPAAVSVASGVLLVVEIEQGGAA